MNLIKIVIFWCLLAVTEAATVVEQNNSGGQRTLKVTYLEAGEIHAYQPLARHRGFFEKDLRIYCYRGEDKTLGRLFESVELVLEIDNDDYTQYDGATPVEVQEHYDQHRSLFSFNLFSQKRTRMQLSPFASSCIGIETIEPYRIRLQKARIDFWRVIQLVVGCLIFHYAGKLSQNALFYYITGVALGICSSFMLLIWLSSKLVPRRTMMYGVLIGGWTIGLYVIQMLWENLQVIVLTYRAYVFWYIFITGVVSFFFCYRWGPPTNRRSKNIIKWLLQLMSLIMIYFSSRYEEATAAFIILIMILHYFPRSLWYKGRAFWLRKFPPKRRFLTNEEYYEQGVRETTKALDELRKFANSPDCNQWKVMSRLRDPMRFAAFAGGASHLRDEEILNFESSKYSDEEEEDSDFILYDSEEEDDNQNIREQYILLNNDPHTVNTIADRRRPPLRESRRVSIEQSGSFLQLNQYKLMDQIGQGSYGLVKLAYSEEDSTHYAMKILSKRRLLRQAGLMKRGPKKGTTPLERVYREIAVLKKLDHPNVVKLIEVLDDPVEDSLYMVFELVKQGEVLSIPTNNPLSEERAWTVFRDTLLGLEYLHYQRIIHADIKPGNLLLTECGRVKIADLGVCNEFIGEDATMTNGSTAGTPAFRAPESLNVGQNIYCGKAADIWALGATLYALVYGNVPFVASSVPVLYEKIKNDELSFPESQKLSAELKDCIKNTLNKDPAKRITLPQLKVHRWVTTAGLCPLPSEEENCRLVQVDDDDINTVVRSIPKLDTLILIKTMLKKHSFGNPFTKGVSGRAPILGGSRLERFVRAGRSNSAPGSYNMIVERQISGDNILPALSEHSVSNSTNEETQ